MTFRIAVAQATGSDNPSAKNIRANGRHLRELMQQAHDEGARLIQFHEGALSGYPSKYRMSSQPDELAESDWSKVAWDALMVELKAVCALARRLKLWTVIGSVHPLTPPHRPHNSLYIVSDRGEIVTRYDKRLISNTENLYMYTPGQEAIIFEVDGWRFGCVICIEVNYPELFMEYERLGVDCILFSTYSEDPMFGIEAQGHAASNSYWVTFSPPTQGAHAISAGVIAPNGQWIEQLGATKPGIVVVDLDPKAAVAEEAVVHRRPWRRIARSGLYNEHFVTDSRSQDRTIL